MKLANVGDVGKYKLKPQIVRPAGLVESPEGDLVLKLYAMAEPEILASEYFQKWTFVDARDFLKEEMRNGEIWPRLGLGFAILAKDTLNVAGWDTEFPIVLINQIYRFGPQGPLKTATLMDPKEIGSFCVWELGIVYHERNAWMEYLGSPRTEADKRKYLESFIEGSLDQTRM